MNSESLNDLFLQIKNVCRFSNMMFRDIFPEQRSLVPAFKYRSHLHTWQNEKHKSFALTTASMLDECENILPKEDVDFWKLIQGRPDDIHPSTLVEYRTDTKISVCFQVENGNIFTIIGAGVYSLCDGLDCTGAPYSFDMETMKVLQRGQVAEIHYFFIKSNDKRMWAALLLHLIANLFLVDKTSKIEKLVCTADLEIQREVLSSLGFKALQFQTNANASPIFILNHLGDLIVERPNMKYCNDGSCSF